MSKDWMDDEFSDEETEAPEAEAAESELEEQPAAEAELEEAAEEGDDNAQPPAEEERPVNRGQLSALLAERERRQQSEREREEERKERERLSRELEDLRRSQTQKTQEQIPDPVDDGQGFQNWTRSQAEEAALSRTLALSADFMEEKLGAEEFGKVKAWWLEQAKRNPNLAIEGVQQANPWRFAYQQYQRAQLLNEVGDDPSAYKARIREKVLAELEQSRPLEAQPKALPPPSLAKGGAGGASESIGDVSEDEFFASVFKK